jgi:ABC-2 type transport system permease protein
MSTLNIFRHSFAIGLEDFRAFWNWRSWFFGWMLRVLTNAVVWVMLGRLVGSTTKVHFLLVGNAVASGASAAMWASAATTWPRTDGTLPLLMIAPCGALRPMMGRTVIWLLNGFATSLLSFVALFTFFDYWPAPHCLAPVACGVLLICLATYAFAMFVGALLSTRPRYRHMVLDITNMITLAFCGVSVPSTFWPSTIQLLVNGLPVTNGLRGIRMTIEAGTSADALYFLGLELCVALIWATVALSSLNALLDRGRSDGSIELS